MSLGMAQCGLGIDARCCGSQLAFPPRVFKDVEFDDVPENLRDLAEAIHEAGAENLFFQVRFACG
jgi:hypothetical protein